MPDNSSDSIESPDDFEQAAYCPYPEYDSNGDGEDRPATGESARGRERAVWAALYGVDDPEMPISVVDLGLIYGVEIDDGRAVVEMTLTYTGCPAREMLLEEIHEAVQAVEGIEDCDVKLVWSPEWSIDFITDAGERALREFGVSVP